MTYGEKCAAAMLLHLRGRLSREALLAVIDGRKLRQLELAEGPVVACPITGFISPATHSR